MYPPIFSLVSVDADIQNVFGTDPIRVFPFGSAPDDVELPYSVWQIISGSPENYISNSPDIDSFLVQFDVYAETATSAREAAESLRDVLEQYSHIVAWRGETRGGQKYRHYRYSFDLKFYTAR